MELQQHRHGKCRVRLARVWRDSSQQSIVEWELSIILSSNCLAAYTMGDNSSIVATDSIKNTVYAKAKECNTPLSMEEFGILLGRHFVSTYPEVTDAVVNIAEKPWERIQIDGMLHEHGFKLGAEKHMAEIVMKSDGTAKVLSGIDGLSVLKTTQSGFEGFIRDKYTLLPDARERILATVVRAVWSYSSKPLSYDETYDSVKKTLVSTFFGPSHGGSYSPSVQNTLYIMAEAVLQRFPEIESVTLNMPNLHFLPFNMPIIGVKFEHDIYLPTDEPHGSIEACLTRKDCSPLSKL
eukprot:c22425_g1_i1 orf=344-1225(-)